MPRHHSPDQKAAAIQCLNNNGGDIVTTSFQTGIPVRTLYTWRKELWIQQVKQQQTPGLQAAPTPPTEIPQFDNEIDELIFIRDQMLKMSKAIADAIHERLHTHMNTAWMLDRIHAQNNLVTAIMKLNAYLKPHLDQRREEAETDFPTTISAWPDWDDDEYEDEPVENHAAYGNVGAFN